MGVSFTPFYTLVKRKVLYVFTVLQRSVLHWACHTSERKYGGVVGSRGTNDSMEWGVGRNDRNPPTNTLLLICEALLTWNECGGSTGRMLLICEALETHHEGGGTTRRMPLICEFWGSRRKSWGPHQLHRWGSDFVLDAQDECNSLRGWSLGLLHHPRLLPPLGRGECF